MGRMKNPDRAQFMLFEDNSKIEKYLKQRKDAKAKQSEREEQRKEIEKIKEMKFRSPKEIRRDYQLCTGKSNPQELIFDISDFVREDIMKDRIKWSKEFYTKEEIENEKYEL